MMHTLPYAPAHGSRSGQGVGHQVARKVAHGWREGACGRRQGRIGGADPPAPRLARGWEGARGYAGARPRNPPPSRALPCLCITRGAKGGRRALPFVRAPPAFCCPTAPVARDRLRANGSATGAAHTLPLAPPAAGPPKGVERPRSRTRPSSRGEWGRGGGLRQQPPRQERGCLPRRLRDPPGPSYCPRSRASSSPCLNGGAAFSAPRSRRRGPRLCINGGGIKGGRFCAWCPV